MTTDAVGGVWTFTLDLARGLGRQGIESLIVCLGPQPHPAQQAEARSLGAVRFRWIESRLEWMDEPWDDVRSTGHELMRLENEFRPDIVHLGGFAHGALPWRAPVITTAHSCVFSWWQAVHAEPPPPQWRAYREAVERGLEAVSIVTAPTAAMVSALRAHYSFSTPIRVIPNGRSGELYAPAQKKPLILSAGRLWDEAKNLKALSHVAPGLPWPTHVAGDTAHPNGGQAAPGALEHLGRLTPEELAVWMGRASIYALPARYEPFGLTALEAALAGCALVLGDIPSLREVWDRAALFVPPNDHRALHQALLSLIESPGLRTEMSIRARQRAVRFPLKRMSGGYLHLYAELSGRVRSHAVEQPGVLS